MSATRLVLILAIVAILGVGAFFIQSNNTPEGSSAPNSISNAVPAPGVNPDDIQEMIVKEHTHDGTEEENHEHGATDSLILFAITYTDDGYVPATVTISAGDTVQFVNKSSGDNWTASAFHPTHVAYPGSGIAKCNSAEVDQIFDACRRFSPGGLYSFTFNEVGEWGFHNHIRTSHVGKIIVQ